MYVVLVAQKPTYFKSNLDSDFFLLTVDANNNPIVMRPNPVIPRSIIDDLHNLRTEDGLSLKDALTNIRGQLVPNGYVPYPFKRHRRIRTGNDA